MDAVEPRAQDAAQKLRHDDGGGGGGRKRGGSGRGKEDEEGLPAVLRRPARGGAPRGRSAFGEWARLRAVVATVERGKMAAGAALPW